MIEGRNLMIVAHPDDETLFGYSELVNGNWHVLSVTGKNRPTKAQLDSVASFLGVTYDIWENDDSWNGTFDPIELSPMIESVISRGFDNILTHNINGEYGHTQHISLHKIVRDIVSDNLYVFDRSDTYLPFSQLKEKISLLSVYKQQCSLNAFDWYDLGDRDNNLMHYVTHEGVRKI